MTDDDGVPWRGTERLQRFGSLRTEAGQRVAAPFPAFLSPLVALFLRCAPDRFLLTKPNTFPHHPDASVATLRWCLGSSRNAVRLPFGKTVQLHRNPQIGVNPEGVGGIGLGRRRCLSRRTSNCGTPGHHDPKAPRRRTLVKRYDDIPFSSSAPLWTFVRVQGTTLPGR
jgi:hypothetical protein